MTKQAELTVTTLVDPKILDVCGLLGWTDETFQDLFREALEAKVKASLLPR